MRVCSAAVSCLVLAWQRLCRVVSCRCAANCCTVRWKHSASLLPTASSHSFVSLCVAFSTQTDADCPSSYCVNYHGPPPYVCCASHFAVLTAVRTDAQPVACCAFFSVSGTSATHAATTAASLTRTASPSAALAPTATTTTASTTRTGATRHRATRTRRPTSSSKALTPCVRV